MTSVVAAASSTVTSRKPKPIVASLRRGSFPGCQSMSCHSAGEGHDRPGAKTRSFKACWPQQQGDYLQTYMWERREMGKMYLDKLHDLQEKHSSALADFDRETNTGGIRALQADELERLYSTYLNSCSDLYAQYMLSSRRGSPQSSLCAFIPPRKGF